MLIFILFRQILQLLAIGINIQHFDFIDRPKPEAIDLAMKQLHLLGAITAIKCGELTEIGRKMAKFPLDPKYSKMILTAPSFDCLEEVNNFRTFYCINDQLTLKTIPDSECHISFIW